MPLELQPPLPAMEVLSVDKIPEGDEWQYEPKWDGFRCLIFRNEWQPLRPKLVVEVRFDHVTAGRFRHGVRLVRWRPDKAPQQCTMDQLAQKTVDQLSLLQ